MNFAGSSQSEVYTGVIEKLLTTEEGVSDPCVDCVVAGKQNLTNSSTIQNTLIYKPIL